MKPAYWIAIMTIVGAVITYVIFKDASIGTVVGIVVGVIIYANLTDKKKGSRVNLCSVGLSALKAHLTRYNRDLSQTVALASR